jgi:hypothetical protein
MRTNVHRAPTPIRRKKMTMITRIKDELSFEVLPAFGAGGRVGKGAIDGIGVGVGSTTGVGVGVGVDTGVGLAVCPGERVAEACASALGRAAGGVTETNTTSPAMMAISMEPRNRIEPIETALRRTSLSKPQRKAKRRSPIKRMPELR